MEVSHLKSSQPLNSGIGDPFAHTHVANRSFTCGQSNSHVTMAPSEGEF